MSPRKNPAAVALGRLGGRVGGTAKTPAKRTAARANGAKGGRPMRCQCGEWGGERCEWQGRRDETVVVEFMPEYLRESHKAAANRGQYPANGAKRIRVSPECAQTMLRADREWVEVIE